MAEQSSIHLDPAAINAVLTSLLAGKGIAAEFADGVLHVVANGLSVTVEAVTLSAAGLDVQLRLANVPAEAGDGA